MCWQDKGRSNHCGIAHHPKCIGNLGNLKGLCIAKELCIGSILDERCAAIDHASANEKCSCRRACSRLLRRSVVVTRIVFFVITSIVVV